MDFIQELWDMIERNPPALETRKVLMQQYISVGWFDAAEDTARELLQLDPSNVDAQEFLQRRRENEGTKPTPSSQGGSSFTFRPKAAPRPGPLPKKAEDRIAMENALSEGYKALRSRAGILLQDTQAVRDLQQQGGAAPAPNNNIQDLKALQDGRISTVVASRPPCSARAAARAMEADRDRALDLAVGDLADVVRWLRSSMNRPSEADNDTIREALTKRIRVLVAALPDELQKFPRLALMHVEHEELDRTYVNDETMYGDAVTDIPRGNFWVSEDGYAWDMDELATCLSSNGGVMRNPLSRQMFTADDIHAIIAHPLGKRLGAQHTEQSKLSKGVRPATIDKLDQLSKVLLADMSTDQTTSRTAIDDFLAYLATLPQAEQKAIDVLRVPATDSHTGQPFDCSIGEAVRDGRANRICLHKTGDLIGQAAKYLRQKRS